MTNKKLLIRLEISIMKDMYAVKCLYKYSYYNQYNELIKEIIPSWEAQQRDYHSVL